MPIQSLPTTALSDTGIKIGRIAHGLMLMTWRDPATDDETAFSALKAGLDLVEPGEKVFINSGEFYGLTSPTANLELVARFFEKYPEYRDRAFISVKGGMNLKTLAAESDLEHLRSSAQSIAKKLGTKKLDLFEPARVGLDHSVEEVVRSLKTLQDEGLFDYIGLSEVGAQSLRNASKIAKITAVEIEVSPWSYDQDIKDVIEAARELNVNVLAYSPLGRGFLTGTLKIEDLKPSDFRTHTPRFQAEAAQKNQALVDGLSAIAKRKGVTNAQLCIAWVASLGPHVIPLPGSSKESRTLENFAAGNITLTDEEKKELEELIEGFEVVGARYPETMKAHLMR